MHDTLRTEAEITKLRNAAAFTRTGIFLLGILVLVTGGWIIHHFLPPDELLKAPEDAAAGFFGPRVVWVKTSFVMDDQEKTKRHELRLEDEIVVTVLAPLNSPRAKPEDPDQPDRTLGGWVRKVKPPAKPEDVENTINKLIPYINGIGIKGLYPTSIDRPAVKATPEPGKGTEITNLHYRLKRTDASKEAWIALLGGPGTRGAHVPVTFSVGTENGETLASEFDSVSPTKDQRGLQLMVVSSWWWVLVLIVLGLIALFIYKAQTSDLIRDTDCDPDTGMQRPYSLARFQMAVWFFIVVGAYLLIWMITRDRSDLPGSVLVLIGLSAGTTIGALVIDANKRAKRREIVMKYETLKAQKEAIDARIADTVRPPVNPAALQEELKELDSKLVIAKKERDELPATTGNSAGFLNDVLNDGDGISFHRFQILVWTGVLAVVFVVSAWRSLTMPEFSEGLLALMGISSGTYLGFKGVEKPPTQKP